MHSRLGYESELMGDLEFSELKFTHNKWLGDKQGNESGILQVLNKRGKSCWNNWYNITLYDTISKESLKYLSHTVHSKLALLVPYFSLFNMSNVFINSILYFLKLKLPILYRVGTHDRKI